MNQAAPKSLAVFHGLGLLVWFVAWATFWAATQHEFVDWDDPIYVSANPRVAEGLTPQGIVYAFTTFDSHNWIPMTWLSHELDFTLFGRDPHAFHTVNVFWHALNCWLLYWTLLQLTSSRSRSAIVAVLFAVHPLHVESVAWISERKDLLSTCALLLTLIAYKWYTDRPSLLRYGLVCVLLILGLLAKSMLLSLPILLILVDIWPLGRVRSPEDANDQQRSGNQILWRLIQEKLPLLLIAIADAIITLAAQQTAMTSAEALPMRNRLGNASIAFVWYLWKTFWPTGLCAFYQHPRESVSVLAVGGSASVLLAITTFVLLRRRQYPELLFGWGWFVIALLPVIGLIQVGTQAHADRYTYIPHIGLFTAVVWGLSGVFAHWPKLHPLGWGLLGLAVGIGMFLTQSQIQTWRTTETLWNRALEIDPNNAMAHLQLGQIALRTQDWSRAGDHFSRVLVDRPGDLDALASLGYIHQQQSEWELSAEYYYWLLRLSPRNPTALHNLSLFPPRPTSASADRVSRATEANKAGLRLARRGNIAGAALLFQQAADRDPQDVFAQDNAAAALEELNRPQQAREYYERALKAFPLDVEARHGLDRIRRRR